MKRMSSLLTRPTKAIRLTITSLSIGIATVFCLLFFVAPASALSLIVNDLESDLSDAAINGNCLTSGDTCTLRAALEEIYSTTDSSNLISFSLSPGSHTLYLTANLPDPYKNVTILGPGPDRGIIDGQGLYRIFSFQDSATSVFVGNLTLRNGSAANGAAINVSGGVNIVVSRVVFEGNRAGMGGAILCQGCTAGISRCRFSGNEATAEDGGAIYVYSAGFLDNMHDVLFENNSAVLNGGAVYSSNSDIDMTDVVFNENTALEGGALVANFSGGHFASVSDTSFRGNTADGNGGAVSLSGSGGGRAIFNGVTFDRNSSTQRGGAVYVSSFGPAVSMADSTITGNNAGTTGGGIYNSGADIQLANMTVTENSAGEIGPCGISCGGGISGDLSLRNSIVAGNHDIGQQLVHSPDCSGTITSGGYNVIGDATDCTLSGGSGDQTGTDPLLGSLARNGGTTMTHAILSGSLAIDGGNPAGCYWDHDADRGAASPELLLDIDQRAVIRPYNTVCDIGSYERTNCDDGVQNNGETGIDCGGGGCAVCSCIGDNFAATNGTTYASIQAAYDATWDGAEIKTREENTGETLTFDRPAYITLIGGHDCDFFRIRGMTTVAGLTVSAGRLTVENIAIGGP
jgi:predicted outer membrane repeat protein